MKMAVFAGIDMKMWRESQKMSAADLAERISCDTTTVYRYESGKLKPDPDTMYQICDALGDVDVWTTWMRTEYPSSYGRMHPETAGYEMPGALLSMFAEMKDVKRLKDAAMKDGADGRIDDHELAKELVKELTEMLQSSQRVTSLLKKEQARG